MPLRANNEPKYYRRFLLIGLAALGFALLCLYDGAVKYPYLQSQATKYLKLESKDRSDELKKIAKQHNWVGMPSGELEHKYGRVGQYVMAGASAAVGFWLLLGVWRSRGRWIEASETGLSSSWGQRFDYNQVVAIDKKKWKDKGIAKIKYQQGNRKKKFVLDDYKFDRQVTDSIMFELESKCGTDKIVGGRPEPPPKSSEEA